MSHRRRFINESSSSILRIQFAADIGTHSFKFQESLPTILDDSDYGFGFSDLQLTVDEVNEYLSRFDSEHRILRTKSGCFRDPHFQQVIKNACGFHIGALRQLALAVLHTVEVKPSPQLFQVLCASDFVNKSMLHSILGRARAILRHRAVGALAAGVPLQTKHLYRKKTDGKDDSNSCCVAAVEL
jgi:hypothetical protein